MCGSTRSFLHSHVQVEHGHRVSCPYDKFSDRTCDTVSYDSGVCKLSLSLLFMPRFAQSKLACSGHARIVALARMQRRLTEATAGSSHAEPKQSIVLWAAILADVTWSRNI